jgi:hypothetical protein
MAIDDGVIDRKSIEILTEGRRSERNTNETGAVGSINTGFESLSNNTESTNRKKARDSDTRSSAERARTPKRTRSRKVRKIKM